MQLNDFNLQREIPMNRRDIEGSYGYRNGQNESIGSNEHELGSVFSTYGEFNEILHHDDEPHNMLPVFPPPCATKIRNSFLF